jgi:nicotinamide mononucleotide transporter
MSLIEAAGVLAGLGYVVFAIRESVWCWPSGIASAIAYVVVFQGARLPGQAVLQAMLGVVCVYGWWAWSRGGAAQGPLVVSKAKPAVLAALAVAIAVGTLAVGLLLQRSNESVLPFWDGGLVAASLAAQWMAARKWLESWLVWIGVNVVSVGVFFSQQLHLTTALYVLYLAMAFVGYRAWTRALARAA